MVLRTDDGRAAPVPPARIPLDPETVAVIGAALILTALESAGRYGAVAAIAPPPLCRATPGVPTPFSQRAVASTAAIAAAACWGADDDT